MPAHRHAEAQSILREVIDANNVVKFRWYKPPSTPEVCCYWDDHETNVLWVHAGSISFPADKEIARPARAPTLSKDGGSILGWSLPGSESGRGGGRHKPTVAEVQCPVAFLLQPAGQSCPECEVVHAVDS